MKPGDLVQVVGWGTVSVSNIGKIYQQPTGYLGEKALVSLEFECLTENSSYWWISYFDYPIDRLCPAGKIPVEERGYLLTLVGPQTLQLLLQIWKKLDES